MKTKADGDFRIPILHLKMISQVNICFLCVKIPSLFYRMN